jgi:acetolactate synthase I/II/III large subunit
MKMTGSQILCECLIKEGVEIIYGVIGASTIHLYDTMEQYQGLHHVMVRHEQGAAHAAEGYAQSTGKVGVCLATSGPGATNLVTGIADAYLNSVPIVAITGQVSRSSIGKDTFQEVDITGITQPVTKHNYLVMDIKKLASTVHEAFFIASSGRPGPVLIDIPSDIFSEQAEYSFHKKISLPGYRPTQAGHPRQIQKAAELINKSQRPLVIAGHGVTISRSHSELLALAEKADMPVATTLLGVSSFPESHALSYGMLGMHGMAYANMAAHAADLVIAIGTRFSNRATAKISDFAPKAKIIHIDIDPAEIGKNVRVDVPIVGDARQILAELNSLVSAANHAAWLGQINEWRHCHHLGKTSETEGLMPQYVIEKIHEATNGDAIIVTGVGQHQLWAAQYYIYNQPNTLITSGGLGTMGFALPAAMGVKMGNPGRSTWVIDGDGSFQMTLHELATIEQEKLDIKIAIINNGYLGMVRQWQELFYSRRYVATTLSSPDYVALAKAYGIPGLRVTSPADVLPAVNQAMNTNGAFLIDFVVESEEKVYPMIPPGASLIEFIDSSRKS